MQGARLLHWGVVDVHIAKERHNASLGIMTDRDFRVSLECPSVLYLRTQPVAAVFILLHVTVWVRDT